MKKLFFILLIININIYALQKPEPNGCGTRIDLDSNIADFINYLINDLIPDNTKPTDDIFRVIFNIVGDIIGGDKGELISKKLKNVIDEEQNINLRPFCNQHDIDYLTPNFPKKEADLRLKEAIFKAGSPLYSEIYYNVVSLPLISNSIYKKAQQKGKIYCNSINNDNKELCYLNN